MNILFLFLARKEPGTPIYHRYKHKHTPLYHHTHVRVYIVCESKEALAFRSKDHNLAIEKDYEFLTSKRNVYYISEL